MHTGMMIIVRRWMFAFCVAVGWLLAAVLAVLASSAAPALADVKPTVTIKPASVVAYTTAHVSGTVNPNGGPSITTWHFEYSLLAEESWTPVAGSEFTATQSEENKPLEVATNLEGLQSNAAYQVRLVATNAGGETISATPNPTLTTKEVVKPTVTLAAVSSITGTSAHFTGTVDPNAPGPKPQDPGFNTTWHFECTPMCPGLEGGELLADDSAHEVAVNATGLLPTTKYMIALIASNRGGETVAGPEAFTTPTAPPTVTSESFSGVNSSEARVTAEIDPGGAAASYRVQYVTDAQFNESGFTTPSEVPAPSSAEVGLPASNVSVGVQQQLTNLQPSTTYHFRFIVASALKEVTVGLEERFTTPLSPGLSESTLPDGRVYELVSGIENPNVYVPARASTLVENTKRPFRAAADGSAVTYLADPASGRGAGLIGNGLGDQYIATRTSQGWQASDIQPAASDQRTAYKTFSSDLAVSAVRSPERLAEAPPCDTLFSRTTSDALFHQLLSAPAVETCGAAEAVVAGFSAETPVPHLVFQQEAALTQGAAQPAKGRTNLYDSAAGALHLVNVLPNGKPEPEPNATVGSASPFARDGESPHLDGAISADAKRIFWTSLEDAEIEGEEFKVPKALWVRQNDTQEQSPINGEGSCTVQADACTVQLDATHGPGVSGSGQFWAASHDGERVFFADCNRLTPDSTAVVHPDCARKETEELGILVPAGNDLYEYDLGSQRLTDLTVDNTDAEGADVQGVIGVNETGEDGAYVYFVALGVLAQGVNAEGRAPAAGQPNLYVAHEGSTTFIATLSPGDNDFARPEDTPRDHVGDWRANAAYRSAATSEDGRSIVFMSRLPLTKYDNESSAGPLPEVYVYDTATARIVCASCDPRGVPPRSPVLGEDFRFGAFLPVSSQGSYLPRWIAADGSRVFFDTSQSLTPQDTNRRQDVYEWEREGVGSCRQSAGCIYLISTGTTAEDAFFVDASTSGNDVFFTDRARLVPGARNENVKLYDARVGGGFPESSLACTGTGCQGVPPAPPSFATPASTTFNGAGNFPPGLPAKGKSAAQIRAEQLVRALKACRQKRSRHKRVACESQARRRYGVAHRASRSSRAARPTNNRRVER